ncbi:MAG: hypothetical protein AABY93_05100 [Bacteroidota bacterium]
MNKNEKQNRRNFLSLGLLTGAAMFTQSVKAESVDSTSSNDETVMLLTPDGKLVEAKKTLVQKSKSGSKASNQEILKWTDTPKS